MWLFWTLGGSVAAVVLVVVLLAASGAFDSGDLALAPVDAPMAGRLAELVSTGQSVGSPDAPVTVLEFGDFQ
jgi:hypothetical protein